MKLNLAKKSMKNLSKKALLPNAATPQVGGGALTREELGCMTDERLCIPETELCQTGAVRCRM
ncbi:hypothetical protein ACFOEE_04190 [Pseudoalteromonas fenneropenaei]|uniref:Uncharacterized protein n=1 Tax=Pseudoalteromonas fenneropenaei TaxID=1737459 RepID=A0ABV7CGK2_9GAMM